MLIKDKLSKISELQKVETPWEVMRIFGNIEIFGVQISFNKDNDYVNLNEAQNAVQWIVEQLGGQVTWKNESKDSEKEKLTNLLTQIVQEYELGRARKQWVELIQQSKELLSQMEK